MSLMAFVLIFSATGCSSKQSTNGKIDIKDEISVKEAKETYGIDSQELTDGINLINTFDAAWIHKRVTKNQINSETQETTAVGAQMDAYSIISIKDKTDITYLDEDIKNTADLEETFGFNLKDINTTWDLFYKLYTADGAIIDEKNSTLDAESYMYSDEKYFLLNDSEKIAEKILQNEKVDYDKITDSYISYKVDTYDNKGEQINYIDGVTAAIYYEKDNQQYMYIIDYGISLASKSDMDGLVQILSNSEMGSCGCAPDSGCNTGTDDPCEPECDMPDKIE